MKYILVISFLIQSSVGIAQFVLPSCEWTRVGGLINYKEGESKIVDFDFKKAELGGNVTDDQVLEAILSFGGDNLTILFSEKEYHFKKQIRLKSYCALKGSGAGTKLIFDLEKEIDPILVQGRISKDTFNLESGPFIQDDYCNLSEISNNIQKNEFYLVGDNDDVLVESWWAKGKTGQVVEVDKVVENEIRLKDQVWRNYNSDAYLIKMSPISNVVISDLTIINTSKTKAQTSNICFRYAYNCLVKNVHSINSNYAHVLFEFSTHSGVDSCNLEKAHDYGNGGKGYGVAMQFATSSCFVYESKFDSLRHSILLQAGANHNYIALNESTNPYWTDVKLPASSAGDIVLHGNFAYANLFEFNKCQTIVIDNSHGFNGPYNTFFNNEVTGYGIWQLRGSSCGPQYFINNYLEGNKVRFKAKDKECHQFNVVNGKAINKEDTKHPYESMIQGMVRY
jgi:ribosomal protein L24